MLDKRQTDTQPTSYDHITGFIQASMSKIQGLLKDSPTVFKDLKLMKNTDLSVKVILRKTRLEIMETLVLENLYKISIKLLHLHLVQHMLH